MNQHDRNNLNFILTADKNTLDEWWESLSDDDRAYALEIVRLARTETEIQLMEYNESLTENSDFAEARAVLQKFRL